MERHGFTLRVTRFSGEGGEGVVEDTKYETLKEATTAAVQEALDCGWVPETAVHFGELRGQEELVRAEDQERWWMKHFALGKGWVRRDHRRGCAVEIRIPDAMRLGAR